MGLRDVSVRKTLPVRVCFGLTLLSLFMKKLHVCGYVLVFLVLVSLFVLFCFVLFLVIVSLFYFKVTGWGFSTFAYLVNCF